MLRVLLFPDSGAWVAQCLELDVCAQGCTEEQAVANLGETLTLHDILADKGHTEHLADVRWKTPAALEEHFKMGKPWPRSEKMVPSMSVRETAPVEYQTGLM